MIKVTASSFFAGIGGTCIAFEQAGVKVVWANEKDENACKTYKDKTCPKRYKGIKYE